MQRFVSLKTKILILCLILITIPFLITGTITYLEYVERLSRKSIQFSDDLTNQFIVNLERYLKGIESLSLAPLYDYEIIDILKDHRSVGKSSSERDEYTFPELDKVSRFMSSLRFDRDEARTIRLYAMDGMVFQYSEYYMTDEWSSEETEWMRKAGAADGKFVIFPPDRMYYDWTDEQKLISLSRLLREPFTFKPIGYIRIDMTVDQFEKALFPPSVSSDHRLVIYNHDSQLIYPSSLDDKVILSKGKLLEFDGQEYFVSARLSEKTGLSLYSLVPYGKLKQEAQILTGLTILISILSLAGAYIMALVFSNRLIRPLNYLSEKMDNVRQGDFSTRARIMVNDETGKLAEGFNMMTGEINRLINEVYSITLKEQEAEIMLLQSQLNPHFLYNTLETINMMAVKKKQLDISDTVSSLGRLLRYTIRGTGWMVSLGEEVEFIENYMAIQNIRLKSRFKVIMDIGKELFSLEVPKLILQPFVENVIEHGLTDSETVLKISGIMVNEKLVLNFTDNGTGIASERRKELEEFFEQGPEFSFGHARAGGLRRGIGLQNINQRLKLLYGEEYGIVIGEVSGTVGDTGALFTVTLPAGGRKEEVPK